MTEIDRAFVAVVPPSAVLDAIEARVVGLRAPDDGLRWSRREQWHLTLRFLGPVADAGAVAEAVRLALAETTAFELRLGGAGAFRREEHGTVLWVGIDQGGDAVARLAQDVERAVVRVGYEPEARDFAPHLTLARTNHPHDLRALVRALGDEPMGPAWTVNEIVLLSSDTRPTGAVYEERARFVLS